MFALADANNFYASCETVFRPDLRGKPICVVSNNDGCVIARSAEAKRMGIQMGAPLFKNERYFRENGVHIFSSNYALYGDTSARMMAILGEMAPGQEIYSIDESFLDVSGIAAYMPLETFGRQNQERDRADDWCGLRAFQDAGQAGQLRRQKMDPHKWHRGSFQPGTSAEAAGPSKRG